jgi:predicted cobalt transporter CbtA
MYFLDELVELLKHADIEGKKLTWNLQVNASAVTVKLIWIKAEKPIATIAEVAIQAPKKKPCTDYVHLFQSFWDSNSL